MSLFGNSRPPSLRSLVFIQPKPAGNPDGVWMHELADVETDRRMEQSAERHPGGILPALTAYLAGIGRTYR